MKIYTYEASDNEGRAIWAMVEANTGAHLGHVHDAETARIIVHAVNSELERDKARLDWLLVNQLTFPPVQIACPDGRPGCLVYHCRPQTAAECRSTIDAAMEGRR